MSQTSQQAVQVSFLLLLIATVFFIQRQCRHRPGLLPPGPRGHWLYGVIIPKPHSYRIFTEWAAQYGPVFSFRVGRILFVSICSHQAAIDIMEKENASLVDRPPSISAGEIMSGGMRMLLTRQGERFRKLRRAMQSQLSYRVVEGYGPIQTRAAKNVVLDILDKPEQHLAHTMRYAATVIISLAYGKTTPTSYSDSEVQGINKSIARLGFALKPGAYLVDSYPILRYVPGYLTKLKQYHREELALFRGQLDAVRTKMDRNEAQPCFAKYIIEKQDEYDLSDNELAYLAGSMFGAGSDTTASAISIIIMAAGCHPAAQKRVQEQLDAVVGRSRVPDFDDMDSLTEVTAFFLEAFRWRPVSAGGFAHRATKDIQYGPYVIPAGATVLANHWAIGKDPEVYADPQVFKPSRWLDENGRINGNMNSYNFGFGRRVCPGQHVANRSVYINTALLLWAFSITEDPSSPIDTLAFTDTANVHPLPFRVDFEPRIPNVRELVEGRD